MRQFLGLFLILLLTTCNNRPQSVAGHEKENPPLRLEKYPENVILMIGDGMGIGQISAGMFLNGNHLNLENFKVVGLHKSYSSDNLVTDSAAGATAFSCGKKTFNGAIGVSADTISCKTILEEAKENNYATGMVVTSTIVHATPASFIAHVDSRQKYEEIAEFFLSGKVDFFVGGGKKYFDRRVKDERNLIEELQKNGYVCSDYFREDFENVKITPDKKFGFFTADEDPLPASQGRDYLPGASGAALKYLKDQNKKGFFLMIEGSQIDWGGHANNSEFIITEMIDFDKAVGEVLDFAKKDGNTLVIVTADHETGGYSINSGSSLDTIVAGFTTKGHTAALIPVFAYGPGAELFGGIYENTSIYDKMRAAFGFQAHY